MTTLRAGGIVSESSATLLTKSSSHHVIFLVDGSLQSVSEEGDESFNQLIDCDSHVVKRRIDVLVSVAKTLAVEGFGWREGKEEEEENARRRFGCVFYDASCSSSAKDDALVARKKQKTKKRRLGCSMLDLESVFQFFASLKHEEHQTNGGAFITLSQAVSQAALMFKSTKMEECGSRDLVILNATEGLQSLSVAEDVVEKMEKMNVTRSAVFFHGDYASPSSSCLWPTAIEGLANASGIAAICNLRPHQDMFLRQSERCLRAELETGGVLREISDGEATNGEATEQKLIEATRRDKILEKNRVQENAMFPTKMNEDDGKNKDEQERGQQLVRRGENCASQFSKFDVLEERLSGLNASTSLRVPILILPKSDANRDEKQESTGKENQETNSGNTEPFIHHVDVEVENIPKVLHAMFEPLLVLSSCSRMRKDKSKKVRPLLGTSGDIIVRQEYFLGNKHEPKVIIEFRKNEGGIDRIASFNRSASKVVSLIWPLKNADARVFCIKHELAKYKKFFYFNRESGESYAERVSQFRAILENPPSLEELSGIESSKTLRDMALAAPSLLGLMCNPPASQPASSSSFEPPPPPIQASESSPTASTFTLEKYRQLELEQKERRRKIRAALTKQKNKNTVETENKVEKEEETPQRQVITNRLQALRDELELRLNEAETAQKTTSAKTERTSQPDEEQEKEKVVSEERNTDDKGEPKDRQSKKVNKTNLLSFFA